MKYDNRSKAIHDALRYFITEAQWMDQESGVMVGVVLILYYLDRPGLIEEVSRLQQDFRVVISSIQKVFVEDNKVLEIMGVKGDVVLINQLTHELMSKKGVKHIKSAVMAP